MQNTVTDTITYNKIVINTDENTVNVSQPVTNTVSVITLGPQGVTGPQGPSGSTFPYTGSATITGSLVVTGSVRATSFTGSLLGTASFANTASFALNAGSSINTGSFATTGSNVFDGNQIITGSLSNGINTVASGSYSHAEGAFTIARGVVSHAEGQYTTANGDYSHAEGQTTTANGVASHAEGNFTIANGNYSHAEGIGTIASGSGQTVVGKYNKQNNDSSLFIIGNGVDGDNRSDIVLVNTGSVIVSGSLNITNGITGSLQGSASFAISSSRAVSASFANTTDFAKTIFPFIGNAVITGSLNMSGSNNIINITGSVNVHNGIIRITSSSISQPSGSEVLLDNKRLKIEDPLTPQLNPTIVSAGSIETPIVSSPVLQTQSGSFVTLPAADIPPPGQGFIAAEVLLFEFDTTKYFGIIADVFVKNNSSEVFSILTSYVVGYYDGGNLQSTFTLTDNVVFPDGNTEIRDNIIIGPAGITQPLDSPIMYIVAQNNNTGSSYTVDTIIRGFTK